MQYVYLFSYTVLYLSTKIRALIKLKLFILVLFSVVSIHTEYS